MQVLILPLALILLFSGQLSAESTSSPSKNVAPKSKLNTQIFEHEDAMESFQDQVKLVRDMAGEAQVLFRNRPGFFILEDNASGAKFKNQLLKAAKTNQSLAISYDKDSRVIKSISEKE